MATFINQNFLYYYSDWLSGASSFGRGGL